MDTTTDGPDAFTEYRGTRSRECPKRMVFGPCGGVRDDATCEMGAHICPFAVLTEPIPWPQPLVSPASPSELINASRTRPVVLSDLSVPAFDRDILEQVASILGESSDAVLVGEHQNRPDYPPTVMAQIIRGVGGCPWVTLTCRDRNRVVLEQELMGLGQAGADGVFCVTGDGRAQGVRQDVTQVSIWTGPGSRRWLHRLILPWVCRRLPKPCRPVSARRVCSKSRGPAPSWRY